MKCLNRLHDTTTPDKWIGGICPDCGEKSPHMATIASAKIDNINENCACRLTIEIKVNASSDGFEFCPLHEAAPDMLEALKAIVETTVQWTDETHRNVKLARAVIAKALGKENPET